jgi:chain length determinant protein EpsF
LLRILHARRKLILLTIVVTVTSTLFISFLMPKSYKSTATLIVDYKVSDPVSGAIFQAQMMPSYMATQVDIASSRTVALRVIDNLKLVAPPEMKQEHPDTPDGNAAMRDLLVENVLSRMRAAPARDGNTINISYVSSDPRDAARIANAFAAAYQEVSARMKVEPAVKAEQFLNEQVKTLRERFELAQKRLTDAQQKGGIASDDNRIDVETFRLNDISGQLVTVQSQLMDAASRKRQLSAIATDGAPDVMTNQTIQNVKAELARAEARFAQVAERFTSEHPRYQQSQAEVNRLRANLRRETSLVSSSVGNSAQILEQREAELQNALRMQKAKVMELNRKRDEIKVLSNELESAKRAYENASQRNVQNDMEGVYRQSDVSVLAPATVATSAISPKPLRNSLFSMVLGIMLGVGLALLVETIDHRVRSPDDLVERLHVPAFWVGPANANARNCMYPMVEAGARPIAIPISNQTGTNP